VLVPTSPTTLIRLGRHNELSEIDLYSDRYSAFFRRPQAFLLLPPSVVLRCLVHHSTSRFNDRPYIPGNPSSDLRLSGIIPFPGPPWGVPRRSVTPMLTRTYLALLLSNQMLVGDHLRSYVEPRTHGPHSPPYVWSRRVSDSYVSGGTSFVVGSLLLLLDTSFFDFLDPSYRSICVLLTPPA